MARVGLALLTRGRLGINVRPTDDSRENVLLVVHDAGRTGAPILGWNLAVHLSAKYNVHVVCLGGGPLVGDFRAASVGFVGPLRKWRRYPSLVRRVIARSLLSGRAFRFAIVNSVASASFIEPCRSYGVPSVLLVHEFITTLPRAATGPLGDVFAKANEIVFSSESTAASARDMYPTLSGRRLHVFPQGVSRLPGGGRVGETRVIASEGEKLSRLKSDGSVIVLGAGAITYRKGVDLFLSTAAAVLRRKSVRPIHFVWVGGGFRPGEDVEYSAYLDEQRRRSGLIEHVTFVDEVADLDPLYELADIFFMSSRLDPMPNVTIDVAHRGIPIVCFDGAGGTGDLLLRNPLTARNAVAYLDTYAAADVIVGLANDSDERQRQGQALKHIAATEFDMVAYVARIDALGRAARDKA